MEKLVKLKKLGHFKHFNHILKKVNYEPQIIAQQVLRISFWPNNIHISSRL